MTVLANGGFALPAPAVVVVVLVRPAPGRPGSIHHSGRIRSSARAGFAPGALGLLVSAGVYLGLFAAMPVPPAAETGPGAGQ
ncbi:hypothetical protein [Streptomyces enissocaesilis]|uniref:DUF4190 domain-containing protein n=1 Tax=Streptomyces enissocaesilis TaxID=332589 RepID=A0ABN3X0M4_9ACTN